MPPAARHHIAFAGFFSFIILGRIIHLIIKRIMNFHAGENNEKKAIHGRSAIQANLVFLLWSFEQIRKNPTLDIQCFW